MKKTSIVIIVILALLLAGTWVSFGSSLLKKQASLKTEKETLITAEENYNKKLWALAFSQYEEVIDISKDQEQWNHFLQAAINACEEEEVSFSKVTETYNKVIKKFPGERSYVVDLASAYISHENPQKAYETLEYALSQGFDDNEIRSKYNEIKYATELNYGGFSAFMPGTEDTYTVCSNELWIDVQPNGRKIDDNVYEYASANVGEVRLFVLDGQARLKDGASTVCFLDGNIQASGIYAENVIPVCRNDRYDFLDREGNVVFGGYDLASSYYNGLAAVKQGSYWNIIDAKAETKRDSLADVVVSNSTLFNEFDVILMAESAGQYKIYDKDLKEKSTFTASDMDAYHEDYIAFLKDGKWGYVNTDGEVVIEPQYQEAKSFSNGLAAVSIDGKWGFINHLNELVIPAEYEDADYFNASGYCMVAVLNVDEEIVWRLIQLKMGILE